VLALAGRRQFGNVAVRVLFANTVGVQLRHAEDSSYNAGTTSKRAEIDLYQKGEKTALLAPRSKALMFRVSSTNWSSPRKETSSACGWMAKNWLMSGHHAAAARWTSPCMGAEAPIRHASRRSNTANWKRRTLARLRPRHRRPPLALHRAVAGRAARSRAACSLRRGRAEPEGLRFTDNSSAMRPPSQGPKSDGAVRMRAAFGGLVVQLYARRTDSHDVYQLFVGNEKLIVLAALRYCDQASHDPARFSAE